MNYSYIILLVGLIFLFGCSQRISQSFITDRSEIIIEEAYQKRSGNECRDHMNYVPDTIYPERTPKRFVRVNVHFMNSSDSSKNFIGDEGRQYAKDMIHNANVALWNNTKMNLPIGNNTPVYPVNLEWVISPDTSVPGDDGIYFHFDDSLWFFNYKDQGKTVFNSTQFDKYGVQKGDVLNIFVMDHPADSLTSSTYNAGDLGVGTSNWAKIAGNFSKRNELYYMDGDNPIYKGAWYFGKLVDHELLHSLGLSHSWYAHDGCDDTPPHPNCWNYTNEPPCDKEVSNNLMDYNAFASALTPCQIARVQYNLATPNSPQRNKLLKTWCTRKPEMDIIIYGRDTVIWNSHKDLEGNIIINNGAVLEVQCSVSLPKDAKITIKPGGTLIVDGGKIYNDCGEKWLGIEVHKNKRSQGTVILRNNGQIMDLVHEL